MDNLYKEIVFENDNPNKVLDFFNRWHQDTVNYLDLNMQLYLIFELLGFKLQFLNL